MLWHSLRCTDVCTCWHGVVFLDGSCSASRRAGDTNTRAGELSLLNFFLVLGPPAALVVYVYLLLAGIWQRSTSWAGISTNFLLLYISSSNVPPGRSCAYDQ